MRDCTSADARGIFFLTLLLWTPSIFLFFKYGGAVGLALSPLYPLCCVLLWRRWAARPWLTSVCANRALICAAVAAVVLSVAIGHPLAKSGRFGAGSDADEALELAVRAVLHGAYPYSHRTHLGNPITPLPGWIALAIPFVLLGKAAYLNIFWFGLGLALLGWRQRSCSISAGPFAWLLLVSCPAILYEAATGVDYIANTLAVMLTSLGLLIVCIEGLTPTLAAALALGITLTSRWNFMFLVPLVFSRVAQSAGARRALLAAGAALLFPALVAATLVALPQDASIASSPLHVMTKLSLIGPRANRLGWIVVAVAVIASLALSSRRANASTYAFLRNAAYVQAILVVGLALTQSVTETGSRAFSSTAYGAFYLCFGIHAFVYRPVARSQ